jgi:hypothetical protein
MIQSISVRVIGIMMLVILPATLYATSPDSPDDVVFVNKGMMNVHTGGVNGVALYVPYAVRTTGSSSAIVLNGEMNVGGHFYQDGTSPAFKTDPSTSRSNTYSDGKFRFVKNWGSTRLITPDERSSTYDRGQSYVAFPRLVLASNDNLEIASQIGIDAISFKRDNDFTGTMFLKSDRYGDDVYDASLRITGTGTSASLVDPGTVIVEREMTYYREPKDPSAPPNSSNPTANDKIFGFATPFKDTQYSGYFAGNWVRKPVADPATGHTTYVFADEKGSDNLILRSQYVYRPEEKLVPAQAYLIKPRPAGFEYQTLRDDTRGLTITDGDIEGRAYDQTKFVFDGKVYSWTQYDEQLFAEDVLFQSPSLNSTPTSTINWLIGNSYTAPLDVALIADAMKNSSLVFSPNIWVWPAGASTYQPHSVNFAVNPIVVQNLTHIPAMGIFMLRLSRVAQSGSFAITKDMQSHAKVRHDNPTASGAPPMKSMRVAQSEINNQVIFRVSPEDNENYFDLAAVGIRNDASEGSDVYDLAKVYRASDIFQLYTLSSANSRLSSNGVPPTTRTVRMGFRPVSEESNFVLTAKHQQTLQSEGLWLEDKKTGTLTDLMQNESYTFSSSPDDNEERFIVHLVAPEFLDLPVSIATNLHIFNSGNRLIVNNLELQDMGSDLMVFNASGRLVLSGVVNNYPRMEMRFEDVPGVYVLHLKGKRQGVHKFIIRQ